MSGEQFTQILKKAQAGDPAAEERFCELVNEELRQVASRLVRRYPGDAQPTSLVNELFVKLFRVGVASDLKNRRYFFATAIDQMRQILRERYRTRMSKRKGGHLSEVPLDIVLDQYLDDFGSRNKLEYIALDEALERLENGKSTPRQAEVVKLFYLAGMQVKEIAVLLGVAETTVAQDKKVALAKLYVEIEGDHES